MPLIRRVGVLLALVVVAALWSGSASAASAPTNLTVPTIFGTAVQDWRLAATEGTWNGSPTSYAYQWQQCDSSGASCADISGETSPTYTVAAGDVGGTIRVLVVATNSVGSSAAVPSAVTSVVGPPSFTLGTTHFLVHYLSANSNSGITETTAGDVAALAERAYTAELAAGYPTPPSDGSRGSDSRTDIYVAALGSGVAGVTLPDSTSSTSSSSFYLSATSGLTALTIAHELFHVLQLGIWNPSAVSDYWLLEGSAEWMGYRVDNFDPGDGFVIGNWDMSLDCRDPLGTSQCDFNVYKNNGYSRWPFFEYLAERYGSSFVKDILAQGASGGGTATSALSNAVSAKGNSLSSLFTDWTVAEMTSAFSVTTLQNSPPSTYVTPITTGTLTSLNQTTSSDAPLVTSGALPTTNVSVNHLAVRYLAFKRGDGNTQVGACYQATLSLSVTLPDSVGALPYFWWSEKNADGTNKQSAQALAISGNTASINVPWDTCDWGNSAPLGYLSLPNPTTTLDAQEFTVSGTITIDKTKLAFPNQVKPPRASDMPGAVISAPTSDTIPTIDVFGPQLIRVSARTRVLQLIVSSSGPGALRASLASRSLGSTKLRAGTNNLRFRLPASLFKSVRKTALTNVLRLTPVSASGLTGKAVVRKVAIEGAATKVVKKAKKTAKKTVKKTAKKTTKR
jgi:hypothetical protein